MSIPPPRGAPPRPIGHRPIRRARRAGHAVRAGSSTRAAYVGGLAAVLLAAPRIAQAPARVTGAPARTVTVSLAAGEVVPRRPTPVRRPHAAAAPRPSGVARRVAYSDLRIPTRKRVPGPADAPPVVFTPSFYRPVVSVGSVGPLPLAAAAPPGLVGPSLAAALPVVAVIPVLPVVASEVEGNTEPAGSWPIAPPTLAPEPSSLALLVGAGALLAGGAGMRRRRRGGGGTVAMPSGSP